MEAQGTKPHPVWLAVDIGSSSIRCSVFSRDDQNEKLATVHYPRRSVQPITGRIRLEGTDDELPLLEAIDWVVDQAIDHVRKSIGEIQVVVVGFACFVMNLVGVDDDEQPVPDATLSYACSSPQVTQEVYRIKR